jgi:hypothetical protein
MLRIRFLLEKHKLKRKIKRLVLNDNKKKLNSFGGNKTTERTN